MDAQTDMKQTHDGISFKNPHVRFLRLLTSETALEHLKLSVLS